GPRYEKPYAPPAWLAERRAFDPLSLPEPQAYGETLVRLMGEPTIAAKEWAFRQYDQQVGTNTLVLPGSDAAVLRIKGTRRAIAISTDGSGRQVFLDPRRGAAMAVCEAARNVSCAGGRPLGVTDCMNFGSPERPEILWQFADAARAAGGAAGGPGSRDRAPGAVGRARRRGGGTRDGRPRLRGGRAGGDAGGRMRDRRPRQWRRRLRGDGRAGTPPRRNAVR